MTTQELFKNFSHGVRWNAAFYIFYKITTTIFTFVLYYTLDTVIFSAWVNINSSLFLLLLWTDFGLRKSITQYSAQLIDKEKYLFMYHIIWFQIALLILALPLFIYYLFTTLHIALHAILPIASAVFISEGCVSLVRSIFHAEFSHKKFNSISTYTYIAELVINITLVYTIPNAVSLICALLSTKLCANIIILAISYKLHTRKTDMHASIPHTSWSHIRSQFIQHTSIMWINNNLKSLSERNFLVPFFTHTIGPVYANIFKVANDAALLFYRIAIKTIGTTDTALLAHVQARIDSDEVMPLAFRRLTTKVVGLCLPLLGIIMVVSLQSNYWFNSSFIFYAFIIMATCYLTEILLLPYERLLEIKQNYFLLFIAYVPYSIMLILLFTHQLNTYLGLLGTIACIHGVRLVSLLIMAVCARYYYVAQFPFRFFIKGACVCTGVVLVIHQGIHYSQSWYTPIINQKNYIKIHSYFARNEQLKESSL